MGRVLQTDSALVWSRSAFRLQYPDTAVGFGRQTIRPESPVWRPGRHTMAHCPQRTELERRYDIALRDWVSVLETDELIS